MARGRNTDARGDPISKQVVDAVWQKGTPIPNKSPDEWRRDICGASMKYSDHGKTTSTDGWEVDHILPVAKGGTDALSNLQPLQWDNNRRKGDSYPWSC